MIMEDVIKAALARKGFFTLSVIVEATGHTKKEVRRCLSVLEDEGCVSRAKELGKASKDLDGRALPGTSKEIIYIATKKLRDRQADQRPQRGDTEEDRIWRAVRYLKRFTRAELQTVTGCNLFTIENFTRKLKAAGYIRKKGHHDWVLVKDPGPARPRLDNLTRNTKDHSSKEAENNGNGDGIVEPREDGPRKAD